jgi:hypothetical protein
MDKDPLDDITKKYEDITNPQNWVKMFPTMESFKKWVMLGTLDDIEATLSEFEEAELYEYCSVILEVINNRKSKIKDKDK